MKHQVERAERTAEWIQEEHDGLLLLFSPALRELNWMTHVFTTRKGGESEAPLDSFNLGRHWETPESKADAMLNRQRLSGILGIDHQKLVVPSQQHTNNVRYLDKSSNTEDGALAGIDGLATRIGGQGLLLHFADCVPVMLADPATRTISVVHAGWRGTASGIVANAVKAMVAQGSNPKDIVVAIGPAIAPCCFETAPEVAAQLCQSVAAGEELVVYKDDKAYPDLKSINARQAKSTGVERVDISNICTACNPQIFYSHRQSGGRTGRQGALACVV